MHNRERSVRPPFMSFVSHQAQHKERERGAHSPRRDPFRVRVVLHERPLPSHILQISNGPRSQHGRVRSRDIRRHSSRHPSLLHATKSSCLLCFGENRPRGEIFWGQNYRYSYLITPLFVLELLVIEPTRPLQSLFAVLRRKVGERRGTLRLVALASKPSFRVIIRQGDQRERVVLHLRDAEQRGRFCSTGIFWSKAFGCRGEHYRKEKNAQVLQLAVWSCCEQSSAQETWSTSNSRHCSIRIWRKSTGS